MVLFFIIILLFIGIMANIIDGITDIIVHKRVDVLIKFALWGLVFFILWEYFK
jgi:hypothetical protein